MTYRRAVRKGTNVLIGMTGLSGTGKTYSAIALARGLVGDTGNIAFLDTENGRGSHYATLTEYDVDHLWPPFTPERYADKILEAEKASYDALIIDSGTHEWSGEGGVNDIAANSKYKGLKRWQEPKIRHKRLVNVLLQTKMHIILCLRAKEKKEQVRDPQTGDTVIVDHGLVPDQDRKILFEMTTSLLFDDPGNPGVARLLKCPEDLRQAFPAGHQISSQSGSRIAEWVDGAEQTNPEVDKLLWAARDASLLGTEALLAHWNALGASNQKLLLPHKDELKRAAAATDKDAKKRSGETDDEIETLEAGEINERPS